MRRSRRRRRVLLAVAGVPFVLVVILVLYLGFADLGRHRGLVEDLVTDLLGRRLKIAGRFEPRLLSLTPSVIAEDVSLANPEWSVEPFMVHVDRLEGSIVLRSIFSGPIRIRDLRVDGAQVRLESDGAGQASWDFDIKPSDKERSPDEVERPPPIIFEQTHLQEVTFSFRDLSTEGGIELGLTSASLDPEESGSYRVTIDGDVNGTPFDLAGNYGPVDWFIVFKRADYRLRGRLAQIDFTITGQMANLRRLEGSDSSISVHGPEIADLTETFGLPSLGTGPFALTATTVSETDGTDVDIEATLGEVDASVHGHVASLVSLDDLDLEIEGAGPNLGAFGALFGADQLPPATFFVSGGLQHSDGIMVFEGVEARLDDDRLNVDGRIGRPPGLVGTDVNVTASGNDLSDWSSVVKTRLPRGAYQVHGRVVRDESALELHDVKLTVGKSGLRADGRLTDPPRFEGSDLKVQASGPDLAAFSSFAGAELPSRSFDVKGTVKGGEERFEFESIRARLGETVLDLDGGVPKWTELEGLDVVVHVEGPDLGEVLSFAGIEDLPTEPFEADGRIRVAGKRFRLTDVTATVGDASAKLDGTIARADGLVGTDVVIAASGRDLSDLGSYAAYEALPADPFHIEGRLRVEHGGYRLDGVGAQVGELSGSVDGFVGNGPALDGSDLEIEVRGSRLADVAAFGDFPELPSLPFSVAGRVRGDEGVFRLDSVHGGFGANRAEVEGWLGPFPDLQRTEISLRANGPDLDDVATAVERAAEIDLPDLPAQEFEVSGQVRVTGGRYQLTDVRTRLGMATLAGHGWIGDLPDLEGTDVTVHASGPQASMIAAIAGVSLPDEPFRIDGRAAWTELGGRFHDVRASVGSYSLRADGNLGRPPKLVGTSLEVELSGPSPVLIGQFVDLPRLPAEPFEVAAHFEGTSEEFTVQGLRATLGNSDIAGDLSVKLREKPVIHASLTSRRVDLVPLLPEIPEDEVEEKDRSAEPEDATPDRDKKRRVIPETPFEFKVLHDQDAEIHLSIETLTSRRSTVTDFELQLNLADGRLRVNPFSAVGESGAALTASLDLEPTDGTYRLESYLDLEGARIDLLSYGEDSQQWPPIDIRLDLSGEGRSPRELAASLDGYAALDVGTGLLDPSIMDLLVFDVMVQLLELLNPFRKDEKFTEMECAVVVARVEDGRVVVDPLAVQTNKMTVIGRGKVDLHNEKLDLDWTSKPRKGIGASASVITNPYIKIGGTLGDPNLEMKPLQAATATGAAVATAGLSLVAKGLWDRITAEKKVCKRARKRVNEIKDEIEVGGGE